MSGKNFTNGSLVMRVWRFDGSVELIGKFQYFDDAKAFAHMALERDVTRKADLSQWFYLAVCDNECEAQAYGIKAST